ncbi:MAG TPA: discoidin domain-containing protein [Verrucomicrobiota bacterium]|nr:discoidin domain-containing protein [Verrucomicrobiota bacterium]HNT15307.1 discoidin domain-containing protein [Verrucomicrobiota bacterium]
MKKTGGKIFAGVCGAGLLALALTTTSVAQDQEDLKLKFPAPTLKGTPDELPTGSNIEPNSDQPPAPLKVAKGTVNVALGKEVTSSVRPFTGELSQLTDGKKEAFDYDTIEMRKGTQWVQVDLGKPYKIEAIAMWHDHRYIQVEHDVILQVSNDPEFKTGVTTLFNNDTDNSSGLGVGADREYFERHYGKVVEAKGVTARYVRGYTRGSHLSPLNCWQEIEVYAVPNQ